ncbi:MAG: hypothetical protein ACRD0Z_09600 [Acidimicrobiales bacterium]
MQSAADAYNELLADDALAAESIESLQAGQERRNLVFGGNPLSVSLRPRLMSATAWDYAVRAAHSIHGALSTLEAALLVDAELRAELDLEPDEETLAMVDPPGGLSSPSSRLDSFAADEVRYVEFNAESPAGMAYGDVLSEVMRALPVMRKFAERYKLRALPTRGAQRDCMLAAFEHWGGGGTAGPSIAIVDWSGVPTMAEFEMFRDYFEAGGVPCVICEPAALSYDGQKLRGPDGQVVNIVYRRVLTSELLAREGLDSPMCRAYLEGAVVVVNSFRAKLLHKKMSLALLSDDQYSSLFSTRQLEAIDRHIPWTRRVRDGRSSKDGQEIRDLGEYILANRQTLVLKPNDEYGGKGVVLGWTVDEAEWSSVLSSAMHDSYVVQESVPVPREAWPLAIGGRAEVVDMAVDMDPYLFGGQVGGALVRLSSSALLNVTAGAGSVVPTYVIEDDNTEVV